MKDKKNQNLILNVLFISRNFSMNSPKPEKHAPDSKKKNGS